MSSDSDSGASSGLSPGVAALKDASRTVANRRAASNSSASSSSSDSSDEDKPAEQAPSRLVRPITVCSLSNASDDGSSSATGELGSGLARGARNGGATATSARPGSDDDDESDGASSSNNSSLPCFTMEKRQSAPRPLKHAGTPRESKSEELGSRLSSPGGLMAVGSPHNGDIAPPIAEEREVDLEVPARQNELERPGADVMMPVEARHQEEEAARLEEERMHQRRKEEEAARLEEERMLQCRKAEEATRVEETARQHRLDEVERQRRESEFRELQAQEEAFWASMTVDERNRLKGMLQALSLYQEQLQQNERVISDLHDQVAGKEKAVRSTKRQAQQADLDTEKALGREARAQDDVAHWSRKRAQYSDHTEQDDETELLRVRHTSLLAEVKRLRDEVAPSRSELQNLRDRLSACEETGKEQASRLGALKAQCQQSVTGHRADQSRELSELRAQHTEEFAKLETQFQSQIANLRAHHAEEVSRLRCALDDGERRRNRVKRDRDEAADQLLARQREGALLQQQCSDARNEVLELSNQVKSCNLLPQVASQLGLSVLDCSAINSSMINMSFQDVAEQRRIDMELQQMRQQCKSFERECARTHEALERKQTECERWRRRGIAASPSGTRLLAVADGSTFTLGPV